MTREQVAKELYTKYFKDGTLYTPSFIEIILMRLEEMDLIKFESEREAAIKEAKHYTADVIYYDNDDKLSTIRNMSNLIKRLVALLK